MEVKGKRRREDGREEEDGGRRIRIRKRREWRGGRERGKSESDYRKNKEKDVSEDIKRVKERGRRMEEDERGGIRVESFKDRSGIKGEKGREVRRRGRDR